MSDNIPFAVYNKNGPKPYKRIDAKTDWFVVEEPADLSVYIKQKKTDIDMVDGHSKRYSKDRRWNFIRCFHLVEPTDNLQVRPTSFYTCVFSKTFYPHLLFSLPTKRFIHTRFIGAKL